jgi:hypothetical protein
MPGDLNATVRDLRGRFGFQNYRLANTYFSRVALTGSIDYKSVTDIGGQNLDSDSPSFLEWSLGSLREASPGSAIVAQPFRFGARVPLRVSTVRDESGKVAGTVNYESIGLNVHRLSFRQNTPTLVGSLNLPKTSGTLFLVITARPVE